MGGVYLVTPTKWFLFVYGSVLSPSGCIIHERGGVCGACPMPRTASEKKNGSEKNKNAHMRRSAGADSGSGERVSIFAKLRRTTLT